jgi:hypothetical protein
MLFTLRILIFRGAALKRNEISCEADQPLIELWHRRLQQVYQLQAATRLCSALSRKTLISVAQISMSSEAAKCIPVYATVVWL